MADDIILVSWDGQDDPLNPANQSTGRKLFMTILVSLIALAVTAASAIDACGVRVYSEYFQVSQVVGSLATGISMVSSLVKRMRADCFVVFLSAFFNRIWLRLSTVRPFF